MAENHAVLVLQAYFSNKLQDSVCRKDFLDLSFEKIISCVQFLYIPLKLKVFERIIHSYKIDSSRESFLDFGSRTLRHLKLVSRLYPLKDRELYVEKHRANLLKLSLPSEILQIVERKEANYRNLSASELIDLYISQTQILKSSSDEIYQVYSIVP